MARLSGSILNFCALGAALSIVALQTGVAHDRGEQYQHKAGCSMTKEFLIATKSLEDGEKFIASEDYVSASEVLNVGISALGSSYYSPTMLDDTGQKLALASSEERNSHHKIAANIRAGVLRSRLDACRKQSGS